MTKLRKSFWHINFLLGADLSVSILTDVFGQTAAAQSLSGEVTGEHILGIHDDPELLTDRVLRPFICIRATGAQINAIDLGDKKLQRFLASCYAATGSSPWCTEVARPNPQSEPTFDCTYSVDQAHYLIHPDESTWKYAFSAIQLVKELELKGIKVCTIYNWWRPEPYNANVGGASGRHPFGTSVDVRLCTLPDMERAFLQLCTWRKQGRLRAVGYYGSTGLHLGMGDRVANTWGKSCPGK